MTDWTPLFREASLLAGPNGQAGVIGPHGEMVHVTSWTAYTTWDDWAGASEHRYEAPVYIVPEKPGDLFKAEIDRRVFWQQPLTEALNKLEAMEPEQARAMLGAYRYADGSDEGNIVSETIMGYSYPIEESPSIGFAEWDRRFTSRHGDADA